MTRVADVVAPEHPALAGHFPGKPVVPGVLLLARVFGAVAREFGAPVARVPLAKFLAPLGPDQRFEIELEPGEGRQVRFRVHAGATLIAQGALELAVA